MKNLLLTITVICLMLTSQSQTIQINKVIENAKINLTLHSDRTSINLQDSTIEFQYTMQIFLHDTISVGEIRDQLRLSYTDLSNIDQLFWNTMKFLLKLKESDYVIID